MKRTATTLVLLAGFGGGGCVSPDGATTGNKKQPAAGGFGTVTKAREIPGVMGPGGEPVSMVAARGATPGGGVKQAGYSSATDAMGVVPASGFGKRKAAAPDCGPVTTAHVPGGYAGPAVGPGYAGPPAGYGEAPRGGILPVPGQGAPGAVASVGHLPHMGVQAYSNQRSSIKFTGPAGMKVTWQIAGGGFTDEATALTAPKEYNFMQAQVYRLRLSGILPNYPGKVFYPTLEVSPTTIKSMTFLSHSSVPITFTNEDFDQVIAGNLVVKVIYLPDALYQDFATVAGAEEIVSTRLEPGADPVAEAQKRGTILAVIRMGNIDLENRASPAMMAPPGGGMGLPPGAMMLPPGAMIPPGATMIPPGGTGAMPGGGPVGSARVGGPVTGGQSGPMAPTGPAPLGSTSSSAVKPGANGGSQTGPLSPGSLPSSVNTGAKPSNLPAFK